MFKVIGIFGLALSCVGLLGPRVLAQSTPSIADMVKGKLIFVEAPSDPYLNAVLHLVNPSDRTLKWEMDPQAGIDSEVTDANGNPAATPKGMEMDFMSAQQTFVLPAHGALDIPISHSGIAINERPPGQYVFEVGSKV